MVSTENNRKEQSTGPGHFGDQMEKEKSTARSRRIGAHLKKLRVDRKLTQFDASEQFGIDEKAWKRFEQGEYLPPTELLLKLHDEWDADILWLLFDTSFEFFDKRVPKSKNVQYKPYFGPKDDR